MVKKKNIRLRGKLRLSQYFQSLNKDDTVAITREVSVAHNFPKRLQGRTGKVMGKRGNSYLVKVKDQNLEKEYIIEAIHLKKLKQIEKAK